MKNVMRVLTLLLVLSLILSMAACSKSDGDFGSSIPDGESESAAGEGGVMQSVLEAIGGDKVTAGGQTTARDEERDALDEDSVQNAAVVHDESGPVSYFYHGFNSYGEPMFTIMEQKDGIALSGVTEFYKYNEDTWEKYESSFGIVAKSSGGIHGEMSSTVMVGLYEYSDSIRDFSFGYSSFYHEYYPNEAQPFLEAEQIKYHDISMEGNLRTVEVDQTEFAYEGSKLVSTLEESSGQIVYEYDRNGHVINRTGKQYSDGVLDYETTTEYERNANGDVTSWKSYDKNGDLNVWTEYDYSVSGKLLIQKPYDVSTGEPSCVYTYEYENGNEENGFTEIQTVYCDGEYEYETHTQYLDLDKITDLLESPYVGYWESEQNGETKFLCISANQLLCSGYIQPETGLYVIQEYASFTHENGNILACEYTANNYNHDIQEWTAEVECFLDGANLVFDGVTYVRVD